MWHSSVVECSLFQHRAAPCGRCCLDCARSLGCLDGTMGGMRGGDLRSTRLVALDAERGARAGLALAAEFPHHFVDTVEAAVDVAT